MKKIKRVLFGLVCIALTTLSFLQSNTKSSLNVDLESLLNISQAQAESGVDCSWGFRKWNCGSVYGDGVDCACGEREQVNNDCP